MSKVAGEGLDVTWDTMQIEERLNMVERVINLETQLFGLSLPAYGSIYHKGFMDQHPTIQQIKLEGEFCIGPSTEYLWWYQGRDKLYVNQGPCKCGCGAPWARIDKLQGTHLKTSCCSSDKESWPG